MENNNNLNREQPPKHSYEINPTTIRLRKKTIYLFSISYNLETNNDDGKIHYYSGKYHGAENGSPVFDGLHDRETNQYIGKKTIANFGQLKPQISEYMGFFRGVIRKEEEKIRERREKERKEIEGGRQLGFSAIDLMRNPQLYNWN
jgi:hypothetical protein